jgi:hypothetical protein
MATFDDLDEAERDALHDLQLGSEHLYRAYGHLISFHHAVGHAMNRLRDAEAELAAAGHADHADVLRNDLLPAGVVDDRWTYELVEAFEDGFLADATDFESTIRAELAGGKRHVTERNQQAEWRSRAADGDTPDAD